MNDFDKMTSMPEPGPKENRVDQGTSPRKSNSVDAIRVAISILDEIALARRAMRITDLADALGETKPRIHRHLATLREAGLVEQEESTERYRLGWRLFQLGEAAGTQFDLRYRAEPYLIKLRDELKQTAVLAVPINGQPVVIATADNIYARLCISVKPGNRPLPHCSAFGRLVLAFSSKAEQQKLLKQDLIAETDRSMTDRVKVMARLALIKSRFYECAESEMMLGINTIATPIFRQDNILAGAIGIVGSIQDIPDPPHPRQIAVLQQFSKELSKQLNSDAYDEVSIDTRSLSQ
ncbi:MAG: IclR family transcriptional regulator [Paralcaligenes sp.]